MLKIHPTLPLLTNLLSFLLRKFHESRYQVVTRAPFDVSSHSKYLLSLGLEVTATEERDFVF